MKLLIFVIMLSFSSQNILLADNKERKALVIEEVMPELNLQQLQLIKLIQEEQIYSKIQNDKDDEQIYTYGLSSLEHPEKITKKMIGSDSFPKIFSFVSKINYFYNLDTKLIAFNRPFSDMENKEHNLEIYETTKSMLFLILYDFKLISSEVELLFDKSESLNLTYVDLIKLFGFGPLYKKLIKNEVVNKSDIINKFNLKTYEFIEKLKGFLTTLSVLRKANIPFYYYFHQLVEQIDKNFGNKTENEMIKDGSDIMNLLLNIKKKTEFSLESFKRDIQYFNEIRLEILDLLSRLQPGWYLQEEEDYRNELE